MTDPTLRQIYLDYDRGHDLDPEDPFITELARRIIEATTQRYGTGDLPGEATGSEIPQLIQGAVNASSPAWQRLDFLIRSELLPNCNHHITTLARMIEALEAK